MLNTLFSVKFYLKLLQLTTLFIYILENVMGLSWLLKSQNIKLQFLLNSHENSAE